MLMEGQRAKYRFAALLPASLEFSSIMQSTYLYRMLAFSLVTSYFGRNVSGDEQIDRDEFFEKRIRPALVEYCLACHSNAEEINGGLLLDSAIGWEKGGDSGKAIERGDPTASLLVKAIEYENPHLQMPPEGKMPVSVIQDFQTWIRNGAFDPRLESQPAKQSTALTLERAQEHWAYRPLQTEIVPSAMGTTDIDRFVQFTLDSKGLKQTEQASRAVLIRRLTYDLHGLPPTPTELTDFEADNSENAYEKLVERLLSSPRYSERMARRWLDVVRYAESLTLRGLVLGNAWRYRDYCIQAFEEDRPWNEIMREQIAGDLMASGDLARRQQQMIAVSFWLMGNSNLEEQDKQQLDMDIIDEQLDTFGKVFLGQTLGCARCHDHKFDPIPTHDYYALAGVMKASQTLKHSNVSNWIEEPLPLPPDEKAYFDGLAAESKQLDEKIDQLRKDLIRITKRKTPIVAIDDLPGIVVDDSQAKKIGEWQASVYTAAYVGEGYIHDKNESKGNKTISFEPEKLPAGTYEVRFAYTHGTNRAKQTKVTVYSAEGDAVHEVDQTVIPPIDGLWISLGRYRFENDGQAYVLVSNQETQGHVIADAVQFLPDQDLTVASKLPREKVADAASNEDATKGNDNELDLTKASLEMEIKQAEAAKVKLNEKLIERPKTLGMLPVADAVDIPIHIRGDVHNLSKVVPRGTLQLVNLSKDLGSSTTAGDSEKPFDRLDLADWLIDSRNPLPARVMVNRVWSWLMGDGLVRTTDNFGTTGEAPSHPELLDYLAQRFVDEGWSIRELVREIVLSDTYQRRSDSIEACETIDPDNRWLWRGQRRRLEAEVIRDSMLYVSGQLDEQRFGSNLTKGLTEDYGYTDKSKRRSVYLPVLRNAIPDLFDVFDVADPSTVVGKRNRSTTAGQALWMMNHPWLAEVSKQTAERILHEASSSRDEQFKIAGRLILGRPVRKFERDVFESVLPSNSVTMSREVLSDVVQCLFQSVDFRFPE